MATSTRNSSRNSSVPTKREMSNSRGLTNDETASDGSAEPSTPKEERPMKRRKVAGELDSLLYYAEWFTSQSFGKNGGAGAKNEDGLLLGKRGAITRKPDPYIIEQQADDARKEKIRLEKRQKMLAMQKERAKEREKERKNKERLDNLRKLEKKKEKELALKEKEKRKKEAQKNKKLAEKSKKKLKKKSASPSSSSTPDLESSILKSRKTTEVKSELVDGYRPFLQGLMKDVQIPIRKDFFVPEIYENTTDKVDSLNFTPASTIIRNYLKKYRTYQNVDPVNVQLNSSIFPKIKEEYYLMESRDFELDPLEEIGKLMEALSVTYFPKNYSLSVYNPKAPYSSITGRLSKGMENHDQKAILGAINEYNELVTKIHKDNGFALHLQRKKSISRAFIHELLNQMYSRAVSPSVSKLKKYEAFSNNVYGELLPNFLSKVFDQVGLSSKSTFIDLGSGVGNVTIQAALEYGCESYGCEVMENASELADLQHQVFNERCKFFGLNPGKVGFFNKQSFVNNEDVEAVVRRCDIILVNNYIFTPDLNKEVIKLFKNLRVGTKIISLKNLVPAGYVIDYDDVENIINRFKVECFSLENGSVSWTDRGGVYYVSEIMDEVNEEYFKVHRGRRSNR